MIKTLIKNRLASVLCGVVGKTRKGGVQKAGKGKIVVFAILYIWLAMFFVAFAASTAMMLASVFIPAGVDWVYFAIFIILSVSLLFVLSIFETKSELFECKDNDLLLSMPIKPRDIVLSRIFIILLYNYLIQAIIMIPAIVIYAAVSGNIKATVGFFIISLFLPLLATALASGVGYLIALLAKRFKKNSFATVGIALVFLIAYFFGYNYLMDGLNGLVEAGPESVTITKANAPIIYAIGASALIKPINFILAILISIAAALIALLVISKSYINVVTDTKGAKKTKYKGESEKESSAVMALTKKEFSRFTSSATYMLNSALGIFFEIIVGVLAVIEGKNLISLFAEMTVETGITAGDFLSPVMIAGICLLSSMNMISASALSLEGKSFWIIKSLPVKERDVLIAKTIPHIVISSVSSLITSLLFMIAISAPLKYWIFFILTPFAANVFSAAFGLVINVQFPKFDYENEAQPVKQSMPVFIVMMVQMLLGLAVVGFNFLLAFMGLGIVAAILTLLVFVMISVVFVVILLGISTKKYATYEP